MAKFSDEKLRNLSKAVYDIGKLSFAAWVLGSVTQPFNVLTFVGGVTLFALSFVIAFLLDRWEG